MPNFDLILIDLFQLYFKKNLFIIEMAILKSFILILYILCEY